MATRKITTLVPVTRTGADILQPAYSAIRPEWLASDDAAQSIDAPDIATGSTVGCPFGPSETLVYPARIMRDMMH